MQRDTNLKTFQIYDQLATASASYIWVYAGPQSANIFERRQNHLNLYFFRGWANRCDLSWYLSEFRPGQPTAGQTCSRKVPVVTTSALPHNATKTQGSCPQRPGEEALELSQGWLEALLPSHRWIRWEIVTSGHIKHWGSIPGFLREPTICGQTMHPTWPSEELCAMLGQRVRDPLSLLYSSPSGDWLW